MVLAGVCVRSVLLVVRVHVRVLCEWGFPRSALASPLACACVRCICCAGMPGLCHDAGLSVHSVRCCYCGVRVRMLHQARHKLNTTRR